MATQKPLVRLTKFDGHRGANLEAFLSQATIRFMAGGITAEEDKVSYVIQSLNGDAAAWVAPKIQSMPVGSTLVGPAPAAGQQATSIWESYEKFVEWLRSRHGKYYNLQKEAERDIHNLRQGKTSVRDYNDTFERLQLYLPKQYTAELLLYIYKNGLNPQTMGRLANNPEVDKWDLETWKQTALSIEANRGFYTNNSMPIFPKNQTTHKSSHRDPDAMDVDEVWRQTNSRYKGKGKKPVNRKQWKCYNCGMTGHMAKDCRKPKKPFKKRTVKVRKQEEGEDSDAPLVYEEEEEEENLEEDF